MSYAEHRRIIDVDSHLFELDDFLHNAARAEHLALLPTMHEQKGLKVPQKALDRGRELLAKRQANPTTIDGQHKERLVQAWRLRSQRAIAHA